MYAGIDRPLCEIYGIGAGLFGRARKFLHFPTCNQVYVPEPLAIHAFGRLIHLQHRIKGTRVVSSREPGVHPPVDRGFQRDPVR